MLDTPSRDQQPLVGAWLHQDAVLRQELTVSRDYDVAANLVLSPAFTLRVTGAQNSVRIRGNLHEIHFVRPPGDPTPLLVVADGVTVRFERCHLHLNGRPISDYACCGVEEFAWGSAVPTNREGEG